MIWIAYAVLWLFVLHGNAIDNRNILEIESRLAALEGGAK